jgi:hypothetical protein
LIIRTDTDESWSNIMDDSDGLILIQQYNYGFLEKTLRKYKKYNKFFKKSDEQKEFRIITKFAPFYEIGKKKKLKVSANADEMDEILKDFESLYINIILKKKYKDCKKDRVN